MKANILAALMLAEGIAGHAINRDALAGGDCKATGKAVYLITNDAENSVIALPIKGDGTLGRGTSTSTGGKGSNSIDGATNQPAGPDALVSQSALTVVGNYIFAVNPGSNSVSQLSISKRDPTKLSLVGQPAAVPGEFPNTVAASAKHNLACVGATGAVAGISCASFSNKGLGKFDALRTIDLGQTTPPVGPTNTVSHAFFSADESTLFTTVKGDPAANKTGFVSSLAIRTGQCNGATVSSPAPEDARVSPEGTAVLFGSQIIPGTGNIFATDASFGAAVLKVDQASGTATVLGKGTIEDQKATCWAAYSAASKSVFVTDVALARLVEMNADDASIISKVDLSSSGDPGFIDLKASGDFLYVLSPGNGEVDASVHVLDLSEGQGKAKSIQRLSLKGLAGKNAQGIAILQ